MIFRREKIGLWVEGGNRTCGNSRVIRHLEAQLELSISDFCTLGQGEYKISSFPLFRVPFQRHPVLLCCYLTIAPGLNYFKYWDVRDLAMGNLGWKGYGLWGRGVWGFKRSTCCFTGEMPSVKGLQIHSSCVVVTTRVALGWSNGKTSLRREITVRWRQAYLRK